MKDEPVYIVSTSFHRSGSSMMMRCLEGGGMKLLKDTLLDGPWNGSGVAGYVPNPNGFYNGPDEQADWPSFCDDARGKLVKLFRLSLPMLLPGKYRLIFMVRDPAEILASMRAWTPHRSWGRLETDLHFLPQIKEALYAQLRGRGDFDILEVNYNDVMKNPLKEFERIKEFGFPIDPAAAAALVDPALYRNRLV